MEALRDRTVKIDIPYITKLSEEQKIYEKEFNSRRIRGKHIAPHTTEMAAMWAVLTRLEDPKKHNLTLLQKLKLYNGKTLPNFTEDNIKELRKESVREGLEGISPRYVQDKISNALVSDKSESSINPFMVLNELEAGLKAHSLISNEETRKRYRELLTVVKQEYEDIVKNEVQRAISADEDAIGKLCGNYIDNVKAYTQKEKIKNKYTGLYEEPDERLMRSIEEKIDIPDSRKDDFRREIMNYIGALAIDGKTFNWRTNERLQKALELKLFEDQKDSIKLKTLVSSVVDRETQEKIDVVKSRLIKNFGYDEESATDVLNFVASIFARGDAKEALASGLRIDQDHMPLQGDRPREDQTEPAQKYVQQGEMIGKKGKDFISIPVPFIDVPHFKHGSRQGGVGQGEGEAGDQLVGQGQKSRATVTARRARAKASTRSRSMSRSTSWPRFLGEELQLPNIEDRGSEKIVTTRSNTPASTRSAPSRCGTSSAPSKKR